MSDKNDLVGFCCPDFSKCGPAVQDIVPNAKLAIQFFLEDLIACKADGSESFFQMPSCIVWKNIPLCLGMCCVPCCSTAVMLRTTAAMSGKSCESECLTCCVLGCCPCLYFCYRTKVRGDFRRKYNIKGSALMDCLEFWCCPSCVACQEANETMKRQSDFAVPFCDLAAAEEAAAKVAAAGKK